MFKTLLSLNPWILNQFIMRYERKYRVTSATFQEVRAVLRQNPASFQTAYPDRYVNSIYLDTHNFTALNDNLGGISDRYKYRLRWYGQDFQNISRPILEKKIKHNQLGDKNHFKMPDFELKEGFDVIHFINSNSDLDMTLQPAVLIAYLRSYFVSQNQKVRATIDRQLCYYFFQGNLFFQQQAKNDDAIILEIKYDEKLDSELDYIFQNIPFRLSKNSKFVHGMFQYY